jgi:hypothetical protein
VDALEARLAALELLQIERLALDPSEMLTRLHRSIAKGLEADICDDERVIREQALQLIEDSARANYVFLGARAVGDND